eukprot:4713163-Pyramimonas_sp.AAC.1
MARPPWRPLALRSFLWKPSTLLTRRKGNLQGSTTGERSDASLFGAQVAEKFAFGSGRDNIRRSTPSSTMIYVAPVRNAVIF